MQSSQNKKAIVEIVFPFDDSFHEQFEKYVMEKYFKHVICSPENHDVLGNDIILPKIARQYLSQKTYVLIDQYKAFKELYYNSLRKKYSHKLNKIIQKTNPGIQRQPYELVHPLVRVVKMFDTEDPNFNVEDFLKDENKRLPFKGFVNVVDYKDWFPIDRNLELSQEQKIITDDEKLSDIMKLINSRLQEKKNIFAKKSKPKPKQSFNRYEIKIYVENICNNIFKSLIDFIEENQIIFQKDKLELIAGFIESNTIQSKIQKNFQKLINQNEDLEGTFYETIIKNYLLHINEQVFEYFQQDMLNRLELLIEFNKKTPDELRNIIITERKIFEESESSEDEIKETSENEIKESEDEIKETSEDEIKETFENEIRDKNNTF